MKNIFTIPPDINFIESLAQEIWRQSNGDSAKLSESLILLPTRRSCRALRDAFLKQINQPAALLPRMQTLGDIDEEELYFAADPSLDLEIPPAITPLRRQLLLTQLICRKDPSLSTDQGAQLAVALAQFLDQVQIENADFVKLKNLVQDKELAQHWEQTVAFLDILTEAWPKMLAEEGCIDPADRRNRILHAQADIWRTDPPAFPVIAAGSTGTIPATADLLDVIASMPLGAVILPGLDQKLNEEAWQAISENHPQYGLKKLLEKCGVQRSDVKTWPVCSSPLEGEARWGVGSEKIINGSSGEYPPSNSPLKGGRTFSLQGERGREARMQLLQTSMLPADVSDQWRSLTPQNIPEDAAKNLSLIEAAHPQEEAQAIALIMRKALDTPNKTAALVTPDRDLAERVCSLLKRWDIQANDSAGSSLALQPVGAYLLDVLMAAKPDASAVDILSLLKHPYAACGLNPAECRAKAREIELTVWRAEKPEHSDWLQKLQQKFSPMTQGWNKKQSLAARLKTHIDLAIAIAKSDQEEGSQRLWHGEDGEIAAEWLDDLRLAATDFPTVTGEEYVGLLRSLMRAVKVRPSYGQHPRLSILGALEARLIQADLVILGGMNEGVWPPEAPIDPWMSRPMKKDFGLPSPERLVGLSAHDFVQLASAPEVVLTRSQRSGGAPTVPSRFLLQLETVLQALGYSDDKQNALQPVDSWLEWARRIDEEKDPVPCAPPEPNPPIAARPTQLSVTEIGTWRRNPYAIYAKHILKLRKLEPLDAEMGAADRGSMIHEALDKFVKKYPDHLPVNAQDELLAIGRDIFSAYDQVPEIKTFWWPRFERIAAWFIEHEDKRRSSGIKLLQSEAIGQIALENGFTLKGRADRIDQLPNGDLAITDYKTGGVPAPKEIQAGYEPQLPLLALIAEKGGFTGVGARQTSELAYWKLNGGQKAAEEKKINEAVPQLMANAAAGLVALIQSFSKAETPYQAVPKPQYQPRYDDYMHLARWAEWGRTPDEG